MARRSRDKKTMTTPHCRFCGETLTETFADLGMSPLSNAFLRPSQANAMEKFYPLHAYVCSACRLVQLAEFETPEAIFSDYLYFSSFSESWLHHAQTYANAMIARLNLNQNNEVIEIASNDGYLLQYFSQAGIKVLGIEPAANVAQAAIAKGISTDIAFFGQTTAQRLRAAGHAPNLIAANNVLAHVPDLNDFVAGLKILLPPSGTITIEFPHIERLIAENQFDTIYHEHFSYFSLLTAERIFAHHGLQIFDVEELSTHGGSLRIFAGHAGANLISPSVTALRARELAAGLDGPEIYAKFAVQIAETKYALLDFLIKTRREGKKIAAYGAPAKGNTLLNYAGIRADLLPFTVDRSPHKQGLLLPGSHIPIFSPDKIFEEKPDFLLILPWNLRDEIRTQMQQIRSWGGQFVMPIPTLTILP
jgi:2-polyprenyl-3-methyl-5-hydroxy-6-metoxy-1,4-benzoquinol methylase